MVLIAGLPAIAGLTFRRPVLPADLDELADLMNTCAAADGLDDRDDAAHLATWFANPSNFDPTRDTLLGEIGGRLLAYGNVRWQDDNDGGRNYSAWCAIHPDLRRRGIGRALLHHQLARIAEIAAGHELADGTERRVESWVYASQPDRIALLESEGFSIARYFFEMVRHDLEAIPDLPLPAGIEIRPMRPEHYRQVWDADVEAFRDHWGSLDLSDAAFQRHFGGPHFEPDLWRVAWDHDQVAGVVANEVLTAFNEQTGARRGLLAGVSVRRPWRRRGLARALVAESLRALRARGMTSATLGVDATNPHGALGVYEAAGFAVEREGRAYRRPLTEMV